MTLKGFGTCVAGVFLNVAAQAQPIIFADLPVVNTRTYTIDTFTQDAFSVFLNT